ncbi:Retrovirus-related Pol polyprotein from transposon TNT 1-94 [Senna tora]|uniref:Retrovirus-related Pol polyprotein from transposon TNT 1-94 n=1 Tax=Senna tora TaxID=362788 RepID=A0A834XI71_9FABA|nr:Retrovirus-related Pol polyprotein from transposon TNT 1-94 [Senna tora]
MPQSPYSSGPAQCSSFYERVTCPFESTILVAESGQKAYKAYDLTTHKIHISRDIIFSESVFPFHTNSVENFINTPLVHILGEDSEYPSQILTEPSPTTATEHHATAQPPTDTNSNLSPISPTSSPYSSDSPIADTLPLTTEPSSSHTDPQPLTQRASS